MLPPALVKVLAASVAGLGDDVSATSPFEACGTGVADWAMTTAKAPTIKVALDIAASRAGQRRVRSVRRTFKSVEPGRRPSKAVELSGRSWTADAGSLIWRTVRIMG